jgi:UDPglucose 6-dehydrogenase
VAKIVIVGTGYVGLTTGACFAHNLHHVCCLDVDVPKITRLQACDVPIYEPGLDELVKESVHAGRLRFTTDYAEALRDAEYVFVAVGTPAAENGDSAELRYVHEAAESIALHATGRVIVVNKSTSPIGTADGIARILDAKRPELAPWAVISNPEFLREGSAVHDCLYPARVVLGGNDYAAAAEIRALYRGMDCPVITTDLHSAEMIKYASNAFLATRISFINEVARICDALDADVTTVARGMGLDPRIGSAFLDAGLGYGGSCFPKDVAALTHMASSAGLHPQLLRTVAAINRDQRSWAIEQIEARVGDLRRAVVAIWGLAFKPNTDDTRDAPAIEIAARLIEQGAIVRAYDPVAATSQSVSMTRCASPYEAAMGADALLLATEWDEFTDVRWAHVAQLMRGTLVFDGRNCLNPVAVVESGLDYLAIGRPEMAARYTEPAISA